MGQEYDEEARNSRGIRQAGIQSCTRHTLLRRLKPEALRSTWIRCAPTDTANTNAIWRSLTLPNSSVSRSIEVAMGDMVQLIVKHRTSLTIIHHFIMFSGCSAWRGHFICNIRSNSHFKLLRAIITSDHEIYLFETGDGCNYAANWESRDQRHMFVIKSEVICTTINRLNLQSHLVNRERPWLYCSWARGWRHALVYRGVQIPCWWFEVATECDNLNPNHTQ